MTFQFWRRWLILVTGGVILYAFTLILLPESMQNLFEQLFFSHEASLSANQQVRFSASFVYAVLGAVMIGWMTSLMGLLLGPFQRPQREIWIVMTASIIVWYVIDSGFSVLVGIVSHALFNTGFLILFAIPLAASYRYLRPVEDKSVF